MIRLTSTTFLPKVNACGAGEMFTGGDTPSDRVATLPEKNRRHFEQYASPHEIYERLSKLDINEDEGDIFTDDFNYEGLDANNTDSKSRFYKADVYFSARPPSAPIKILPFSEEIINDNGDGEKVTVFDNNWKVDPSSVVDWIVPVLSLNPPEPYLKIDAFLNSLYQKDLSTKPEVERISGMNTVKLILAKLFDDLPLMDLNFSPVTVINNIESNSRDEMSPTCTHSNSDRRCNIAVQTHPNKQLNYQKQQLKKQQDNQSSIGEFEKKIAKDWMGGVRALRDSHVRLVLRQLRHVYRMNRTIDRVSRATTSTH